LSPSHERELAKPLFPRTPLRLWYARHAAFCAFDPLRCALSSLADVATHARLPLPAEGGTYDVLVVAAPRHDHPTIPVAEAERLAQLAGDKPVLYLAPTPVANVKAAAAQLRQFPLPLSVLAELIAAAATAAITLPDEGRGAAA
jgi:hypothetical protein